MAAKTPAAKTRIQKAGKGHSYFLDGVKVPGVTTIIGNGLPKPNLVGWAANTTADFVVNTLREDVETGHIIADDMIDQLRKVNAESRFPQKWNGGDRLPRLILSKVLAGIRYRDRDQAANRGREVHDYAEKLARGEEVTPPEEIADHVAAYVRFLNEWGPANALLERVVVNRRWGYMGKFDILAEFPGKVWASGPWQGKPVGRGLLDVKTSRSGIFPEVGLQLVGYGGAETMLDGDREIPMPKADWCGAIHVRADGYDVIPFRCVPGDPNDPTWRAFLYVKQVADWAADDGVSADIRLDAAAAPAGVG